MKNLPLLIGTIFGTIILVVFVAFAFSNSASEQEAPVDPALLAADARLTKGPEDAKVTIVEFADFQCPACRAASALTPQVMAQYPDDVRVIYRHFPLVQIHPNAQPASLLSEAAYDQGKFWEMHDLLFERQTEWSSLTGEELNTKFVEYAEELEIDKTQLLERIESPEVKDRVAADISLGEQVQVAGTPTFFVNGQRTPAPELFSTVESALNM